MFFSYRQVTLTALCFLVWDGNIWSSYHQDAPPRTISAPIDVPRLSVAISFSSSPLGDTGLDLLKQASQGHKFYEMTLSDPNLTKKNQEKIKETGAFSAVSSLALTHVRSFEGVLRVLDLFPSLKILEISQCRFHSKACESPRMLFTPEAACFGDDNQSLSLRCTPCSPRDAQILMDAKKDILQDHVQGLLRSLIVYVNTQNASKKEKLQKVFLPWEMVFCRVFQDALKSEPMDAFEMTPQARWSHATPREMLCEIKRRKDLL